MRHGIAPAITLIAVLLSSSAAQAAVSVIGNGMARDCYLRAEHDLDAPVGDDICTQALDYETLSVHDRAATYVNRGVIRSNLHQFKMSMDDYDRAIALAPYLKDPDLGVAYVDRASVLNVLGRFSEALDDANKGLSLGTPRPEVAYYNRGLANEGLGHLTAAYYDYKKALELVPTFKQPAEELKRFHVVTKSDNGT